MKVLYDLSHFDVKLNEQKQFVLVVYKQTGSKEEFVIDAKEALMYATFETLTKINDKLAVLADNVNRPGIIRRYGKIL